MKQNSLVSVSSLFQSVFAVLIYSSLVLANSKTYSHKKDKTESQPIDDALLHKHEFLCPNGFIRYHRSCYKVSSMHATWLEARAYCNAMGAGLVTIETKEEQSFLVNIIKKHKLSYPRSFWTGGNDLAMEDEWEWVSTFQKILYKNWFPGQPDNGRGREHCLELEQQYNYHWNDQPCHMKNHFICEMYMV